jgi:hypothetical protein
MKKLKQLFKNIRWLMNKDIAEKLEEMGNNVRDIDRPYTKPSRSELMKRIAK